MTFVLDSRVFRPLPGANVGVVVRAESGAVVGSWLFEDGVPRRSADEDNDALARTVPVAELQGPVEQTELLFADRCYFRDIREHVELVNDDISALMILTGILHHPRHAA